MYSPMDELILKAEIITLAVNKLTGLRLSDNLSVPEMIEELPQAVQSVMEIKGASLEINSILEKDIIEYLNNLLLNFANK